ncbi:MAG: tRNA (adenosine(37)-N6)-threonylcarbamoyltransferase complex ATPase subunit type 1 TsaE [Candidatus Tectomicrobia bacterium]|nr:tRNA (adenosine(37)-N6)-threonylcarbamoyltransferase complex ATPase subunit type 1 TsaE [Candidatus Tectomicrobia bacterium]
MVLNRSWHTSCAQETEAVGFLLGKCARGGDVVMCSGPLGAGKTTLVQGFARGLGIDRAVYVRSPTFTLVNEYQGPVPLYHLDFYRLENVDEVWDVGFEEYLEAGGVVIVEWADKFPSLFSVPSVRVRIEVGAPQCRRVECTSPDRTYARYFQAAC